MQYTVTTEMGYALESFTTREEATAHLVTEWGETIAVTPDTIRRGDDVSEWMTK